jgi:hypothetical protein
MTGIVLTVTTWFLINILRRRREERSQSPGLKSFAEFRLPEFAHTYYGEKDVASVVDVHVAEEDEGGARGIAV